MSYQIGDVFSYDGGLYEITAINMYIWGKQMIGTTSYYYSRPFTRTEFEQGLRDGKITLGTSPNLSEGRGSCSHNWARYTGVREVYDYCVHCDAKREVSWKELK